MLHIIHEIIVVLYTTWRVLVSPLLLFRASPVNDSQDYCMHGSHFILHPPLFLIILHLVSLSFSCLLGPSAVQCFFLGDLGSFSWEKTQKLDYRKNYRITYSEWGIWCVKDHEKLVRLVSIILQHSFPYRRVKIDTTLLGTALAWCWCCTCAELQMLFTSQNTLLALPSLLWMSSFVHLLVWWCCPGKYRSLPGVIFLNWL